MTRLISPLFSEGARGKVGSLVYSIRRGTYYVRKNSAQTHPNTQSQLQHRAIIAKVTKNWNNLSDQERKTWYNYANEHTIPDWTGEPKRVQAQAWYIKFNSRLERLNQTERRTAPENAAPSAPRLTSTTTKGLKVTISWTIPSQPTNHQYKITIWRAGPNSAGRLPRRERARIIANVNKEAETYEDLTPSPGTYAYWLETIDTVEGTYSPEAKTTATTTIEAAPVLGKITGKLKQHDNTPIIGWTVWCDSLIATSDETGTYTFENLEPGDYTIQPEDRPDGEWEPGFQGVHIEDGETVTLPDFELIPF